ncbi:aquaporin [Nakamurella leprariae]|uniref:Aquaporin n=1 Tax=Nakamurella leprariae TaxID=2803911 RepID=A0A938YDV8_9ACTN|nr:aquaporin [Nakamurella leprariae]MBM9468902.1 aquaporin [Nakamurella leprariae]
MTSRGGCPGYVVAQLAGATLTALFLQAVIDVSASNGANHPAADVSDWTAFLMEAVLTFGLVSVILGTAAGAQNVGVAGALGVGSSIAAAGRDGSDGAARPAGPGSN